MGLYTIMNIKTFRETLFWPLSVPEGTIEDIEARLNADRRWQKCSQPFASIPDTDAEQEDLATRYSAAVYMHPFVQKLLYPHPTGEGDRRPALRRYQPTEGNGPSRIRVTLSGDAETEISFKVDRLELSLFRAGIVILRIDLCCDTPNLSLAMVQQSLDEVRRCYVPFWKGDKPGHVPAFVAVEYATQSETWAAPTRQQGLALSNSSCGLAPPLLPWWAALLAPLSLTPDATGKTYLSHVVDDRLPGMAFLTLDDPTTLGEADWVRLCFADPPGSGLPYAASILRDFDQNHCYDRFWEPARAPGMCSRYLLAGYQFTFVGRNEGFTLNVLQGHFRHHYADMALVLQYQQAALLRLMERLTPPGNGRLSDPEFRQRLRDAQDEWLDFLGHGWFPTLSNQVQGQELFEKWRDQMRLPALYREVSEKARDMTAMLNAAEGHEATQEAHRATEAGLQLNKIAAVGLVASLITSVMGVNLIVPDHPPLMLASGWSFFIVGLVTLGAWLTGRMIAGSKPTGSSRFLRTFAINCLAIAALTLLIGSVLILKAPPEEKPDCLDAVRAACCPS